MGIFSEDEARDCYHSGLQAKAESWEKMMRKGPDGFRPCPICGKPRTASSVIFLDDEGCEIYRMSEIMDQEGHPNASKIGVVEDITCSDCRVGMSCECGLGQWMAIPECFPEEGWFRAFKGEMNRRMGE